MCGILGFIGKSKNHSLSQQLVTVLFQKMQSRGIDASGFYCASDFDKKEVYFFKQPEPSTVFVNNTIYKKLWGYELNLGIFHCRAATQGVGVPADNRNNHPFVSENFQKALIHNGFINKLEYKNLKSIYETNTDCDSEIILRMLEQESNLESSLCDFLSSTEKSAYAVAYAEVDENLRSLTLFRNQHRPMVLIDLRDCLGQLFFCSTAEIFFDALSEIPELHEAFIGVAQLEQNTVTNVRFDIANNMSVLSYDLAYTGQILKKNNNQIKLQNHAANIFTAPINFDISNENNTKKTNIMKKLEQVILLYNRKHGFSDVEMPNDAIGHHAKMLQDLLQKEVL